MSWAWGAEIIVGRRPAVPVRMPVPVRPRSPAPRPRTGAPHRPSRATSAHLVFAPVADGKVDFSDNGSVDLVAYTTGHSITPGSRIR